LPSSQSTLLASPSTCARCGALFHCGRDDPAGCWCARLPALPRDRYGAVAGCLCEDCLRRVLDAAAAPPRAGSVESEDTGRPVLVAEWLKRILTG